MEYRIDQAKPVRAGEELDLEKLNMFLQHQVVGIDEITEASQYPGGFSNLTYCIKTSSEEYVLRRPPFGANIKSAHDMGREFRVLSLLKNHYSKVPQPIAFCEDENVLGAPFYIMERLQGVILRAANAPKMNIPESELRKVSEVLVDNLVELHGIDIEKSGLISLGKPEGFVTRQVEGWIKRYYNAETDKIESLDKIAAWLRHNIPTEQKPAFLHNDYKYDNLVLEANNLSKIIGVLDWEMSTVGDPMIDLGATLAYWSEIEDSDEVKFFNLTWLPGNLTKKEVVERYAALSGRDVSNVLYYYIFGLFKNAAIAQQIYARWKQGFTKDERFGMLIHVIKGLGLKAEKALSKGEI